MHKHTDRGTTLRVLGSARPCLTLPIFSLTRSTNNVGVRRLLGVSMRSRAKFWAWPSTQPLIQSSEWTGLVLLLCEREMIHNSVCNTMSIVLDSSLDHSHHRMIYRLKPPSAYLSKLMRGISFPFFFVLSLSNENRLSTLPSAVASASLKSSNNISAT